MLMEERMTPKLSTFDRKTRNLVAKAADGLPDLGTWLSRIEAIGHPALHEAIDGIWCGRSGEVRLECEGWKSLLCMGWHNGRVEWSYLS